MLVTFYQLNFGGHLVYFLQMTNGFSCHLVFWGLVLYTYTAQVIMGVTLYVYCYNVCHLVGPVPAVSAPRGLAPVAAGLVSRVLVLPHAQPAGGLARGPGQVIFIYS